MDDTASPWAWAIEPGPYRTRDGRVAEIEAQESRGYLFWRGTVDGKPQRWMRNGRWRPTGDHALDLMAPACPPPNRPTRDQSRNQPARHPWPA